LATSPRGGKKLEMATIILARAGTTDYDEQDRIIGTLDIPVNLRGQAELADMARELRGRDVSSVYATASESAQQSASFLAGKLNAKMRVLDGLRNQDFGLWQGMRVEELKRKHRRVYKQYEDTPCAVCPPAGEMIEQVFDRVTKGIRPLLKRVGDGTVVLFAPDPLRQVIRCYLRHEDLNQLEAPGEDEPADLWEAIEVI
jgi:broad specificity phosphatase PhoE